jgi:tRNA pseudouridine55 synthase
MNGIIIVNKEKGYTSRDVVNVVGKTLGTKKVGHTGTLDPIATGVLVICVGDATKLADIITSNDKEYVAKVILGLDTDTLDVTGTVLKEESTNFSKNEILEVLNSFLGTYEQEVPKYSAVKIDGKKLYEYARSNVDVVLPKRQVTVNLIELVSDIEIIDSKTVFTFKTNVSKGTYIRSLIRDIALKLGTVGVMAELVRTKHGRYNIEESCTLEQIKNNEYKLYDIKEIFNDVKQVEAAENIINKIKNGNPVDNIYDEDQILFLDSDQKALALYVKDGKHLKAFKMFYR